MSMEAWRREVASRVQQHRARRRKQADPNALELDFSTDEPYSFAAHSVDESDDGALPPPPRRFAEITLKPEPPKVIRFPRTALTPPPAVEEVTLEELELARPSPEKADSAPSGYAAPAPRIIEDPGEAHAGAPWEAAGTWPQAEQPLPRAEQMELLPSFEDIHLEPEARRLDDELDNIPRPAPLGQRAVAGLVDAAIVFIASGVFAITFFELAEEMPQSRLTAVCAMAAAGLFWLVFQYMFLTFRRATPGMRVAQLELCTFDGRPAPALARQVRAVASALAGFAGGLGYAWALVDEDRLGWHDRISQTCLKASTERSAVSQKNIAADCR